MGALIYQENKRKSYSGDNHAILSTGPDSIKDFVNEFFYKVTIFFNLKNWINCDQ